MCYTRRERSSTKLGEEGRFVADPDVPVVNVPISGGVQYGKYPTDFSGTDNDPGGGGVWSQFAWFNPLEVYCSDPSTSEEDCDFWCETCGDDIVPQVFNLQTLPGSPIAYPKFTPQNIQGYGLCQIFWLWVFSKWVSEKTGVAENLANAGGDPLDGPGGTGVTGGG